MCGQVCNYLAADGNIARWQQNLQKIESIEQVELRNQYFEQQMQFLACWRQQGAEIPLIPENWGFQTEDREPAELEQIEDPEGRLVELKEGKSDLAELELRPVGQGWKEPWQCGFCKQGGNTAERCVGCNRVNFQTIVADPIPDDLLALFNADTPLQREEETPAEVPPDPEERTELLLKNWIELEVRRVGELTGENWECGNCRETNNQGVRCRTCNQVNFQAVSTLCIPEEVLTTLESQLSESLVSTPPPVSPLPQSPCIVAEKCEPVRDVAGLEMRRVGEFEGQIWHCDLCGKDGNQSAKCTTCHHVNFQSIASKAVLEVFKTVGDSNIPLSDASDKPPPDSPIDEPKEISPTLLRDIGLFPMKRVGEEYEKPWECTSCSLSNRKVQRCLKCDKVNFQAVSREAFAAIATFLIDSPPEPLPIKGHDGFDSSESSDFGKERIPRHKGKLWTCRHCGREEEMSGRECLNCGHTGFEDEDPLDEPGFGLEPYDPPVHTDQEIPQELTIASDTQPGAASVEETKSDNPKCPDSAVSVSDAVGLPVPPEEVPKLWTCSCGFSANSAEMQRGSHCNEENPNCSAIIPPESRYDQRNPRSEIGYSVPNIPEDISKQGIMKLDAKQSNGELKEGRCIECLKCTLL